MTAGVDLYRLNEWTAQNMLYPDPLCRQANCALTVVTPRSAQSNFFYGMRRVALPPQMALDVYSFPIRVSRGRKPGRTGWLRGDDLLNTDGIRLIVHDSYGRLVPLGCVYVLYHDCQIGFIAVRHDALVACTTPEGRTGGMVLTYRYVGNGAGGTDTSVSSIIPPLGVVSSSGTNATTDALNSAVAASVTTYEASVGTGLHVPATTTLWVNGQARVMASSYAPAATDFVEWFTDTTRDVFTVHIDDATTGYMSSFYKSYREILHCPKRTDLGNTIIIPHDVLEIVVYDTATGLGQHFSRYSPQSVRQITHQDWSIDRTQLDAIKTGMGNNPDLSVLVIVTKPVKVMPVIADVNYMTDLYRCDDKTILRFLQGTGDSSLPFWRADQLEQSQWHSLLFTGGDRLYPEPGDDPQYLPVPSVADNAPSAPYYASALGFYHTATILSSGIRQTAWYDGFFTLNLPRALMGGAVYPYIFVNGRKIPDQSVTASVLTSQVDITLASGTWKDGDRIQSVLRDASGGSPIVWTPTEDSTTLTVPAGNFTLYTSDGTNTYVPVAKGPGTWMLTQNTDGTFLITVYPAQYGKTFLYYPDAVSAHGAVSIDAMITNKDAILFPIQTSDGHPLLTYGSLDVFLNGYWLVKGVDYFVVSDNPGYRIVITNRDFLSLTTTGNQVEWYVSSEGTVSDVVGYVDNGVLAPSGLYFAQDTLSELYISGLLVTNGIDQGVYMEVPGQISGSVCEFTLRYPDSVLDQLPSESKEVDDSHRSAISAYFASLVPPSTAIAQSYQHQIYSPWLQSVIRLVCNGTFVPLSDPNDSSFVRQFPDPYKIKASDPTLVGDNVINRQFVSVAATYTMDMDQTPAPIQAMVQRLIALTLNRAPVSIGVTPT